MERYPLKIFLHGFVPGCGDIRWEPPPVPRPPPMGTAAERAADLTYLITLLNKEETR